MTKISMEMTESQMRLWEIGSKAIKELGGISGLTGGLATKETRQKAREEGTRENALKQAWGFAHGKMPDDETCEKLIKLIENQ